MFMNEKKAVRIYRPSKNAMQSGVYRPVPWILEFKPTLEKKRTEQAPVPFRLAFSTLEQALLYAKKNDYTVDLEKIKPKALIPKNYGENFLCPRIRGESVFEN